MNTDCPEDGAPPSQAAANRLTRVLQQKPLKFTASLYLPDGRTIEFQCEKTPQVKYSDEDRSLWLFRTDYGNDHPIMRWPDGAILLVEENPKP